MPTAAQRAGARIPAHTRVKNTIVVYLHLKIKLSLTPLTYLENDLRTLIVKEILNFEHMLQFIRECA